jgi:Ca-activated chloride channel family protein
VAAQAFYREHALAGSGGDTAWFNLGTVALAAGDTSTAREALERAARSVEPELRFRALFNLGLLELQLAAGESDEAAAYADAAARRYREALLLDPHSAEAKWNYEMALRLRAPQSPEPGEEPGGGGGQDETEPPPPRGLTPEQAELILLSVAETERETLRDQADRMRREAETRGRREW